MYSGADVPKTATTSSLTLSMLRAGGTGSAVPAGPALAGPLFSDQVINIHNSSRVWTAAAQSTAQSQSGRSQAWSSALLC